MTNDTKFNAAIESINAKKTLVHSTMQRAKGTNFITPMYLSAWKVRNTPYVIEISTGTYMDGSTMYGLAAFVSATGEILHGSGKASDAEHLEERLQSVVDHLLALHQRTKEGMPNAE